MPIYEYRCGECGHQKEVLQRISDAPLTDCPVCGKRAFNKMVTAAGFQLKGTGWYATDFRNSGTKAGAKSGKSTDTGKTGEGASSSDSGTKDSGSKDGGSKDSGSKDSGSKDGGSKDSSKSDAASGAGASA